jgi:hypothetical protein
LRQLRRDPLRQRRRFAPLPARYGARHDAGIEGSPGRRMRLLEVIDLTDVLGPVGELEGDSFTVAAGREAPALYDRHFMRHLSVERVVRDRVDAGLRDDIARSVFLCTIPVP